MRDRKPTFGIAGSVLARLAVAGAAAVAGVLVWCRPIESRRAR